jgi:Protein of unknown function (DUF2442)
MNSASPGTATSVPEVTNVSAHGLWLLLDGEELFLPFAKFPWFRNAPIGGVTHVERPAPHHLRWPDLDVDLAVESIRDPDAYPLVSSS